MKGFHTYFRQNYVQAENGGAARFPITNWNHWESLERGWPRSNNYQEGYNRALGRQFHNEKPKFSLSLRIIKKQEEKVRDLVDKFGLAIPAPIRKRQAWIEEHLKLNQGTFGVDSASDEGLIAYLKRVDQVKSYRCRRIPLPDGYFVDEEEVDEGAEDAPYYGNNGEVEGDEDIAEDE